GDAGAWRAGPARAAEPDTDPWRAAGRAALARAESNGASAPRKAKNVILFVGDGMGVSTVTAARIFDGQRRGGSGEEHALSFETFPHVALAKTYTVNAQVAESAATMTALVTGVKTREDVIALDARSVPGDHTSVEGSRVRTLLEEAESRGLATGVVTTTRITHATPAACYAHVPQRDWEDDSLLPEAARAADFPDIARQFVDFAVGDGIDVAFGGGRSQFLPIGVRDPERPDSVGNRRDRRNLIDAWRLRNPNGRYVTTRSEFASLDPARPGPVLGLFEPSHMRFESERGDDVGGEPSLSEMTAKAIELLARDPDGFFLMVEGGRIDHAHHLGNAYRALVETVELSNAVRTAQAMVSPSDTLIVVTADHSHVLTIAGYPTRGNDILGLVHGNDAQGQRAPQPLKDMLGLPFTTLNYANGPGYTGASPEQREGPKRFPHQPTGYRGITRGRPDLRKTDVAHPDYLQESAVPGRNDTHAGEDVAIYATGPGAAFVQGVQEQSYVYYVMRRAYGWADGEE
ncbi:MAG: alkaline phosphatase, partial [Proteobacteria bacterium]